MDTKIKDIVIVGDPHLNSSTPSSRIDIFADTSIEKLETLLDLCKSKNYKTVVLLGDVFHKPQQPINYIYRVINAFLKFKRAGITVYSIVGNSHDVPYDKVSYLPRTALGLLFQTQALHKLESATFISQGDYSIGLFGYDYEAPIVPLDKIDYKAHVNICVCHRYFEYGYSSSSLTKQNIRDLGYNIYCMGHEHQPHDVEKVDNHLVVRPGRFMRGTADDFNIEDTSVYVDVLKFAGDIKSPKISVIREVLPTKAPSDIFSTKALSKDSTDKILSSLSDKVNILLDKLDFKDNTKESNVYTVLDSLEVDVRIKNRIETYIKNEGIVREEINII